MATVNNLGPMKWIVWVYAKNYDTHFLSFHVRKISDIPKLLKMRGIKHCRVVAKDLNSYLNGN